MEDKITFTYKDKEYTLRYTRATVSIMEKSFGFAVTDMLKKTVSSTLALFKGAFLADEIKTPDALVDEIFENMKDKNQLYATLLDMYTKTVNSVFAEPKDEKNAISWGVSGK